MIKYLLQIVQNMLQNIATGLTCGDPPYPGVLRGRSLNSNNNGSLSLGRNVY